MPHDLISLKPADTPDYMTDAWLGFIQFGLSEPRMIEAFRQDTGNKWQPGRTPIDKAIDRATDAEWAFLKAFVEWLNVNHWGPIDA